MKDKVVISCAVTGGIHTPTMSDALPITPAEIARQAIDAVAAGAAIVHLHARDPATGRPDGDPAIFGQFLPVIRHACDAVINITTGGSPTMPVSERLAGPRSAEPELCSLNMGSINFGLFPMAARYSHWKHDWEEPYLRSSDDFVFRNSFRDIEHILRSMTEVGTRFEHECYDVGHLYNLAHFIDRGLIEPPFFVQMVFGILGGIGASPENLDFMKLTADRLFGPANFVWSVLGAGRHQMAMATQAALMGGHVRVGLGAVCI